MLADGQPGLGRTPRRSGASSPPLALPLPAHPSFSAAGRMAVSGWLGVCLLLLLPRPVMPRPATPRPVMPRPRLTFPLGSPSRPLTIFKSPDVFNTTTLLLSDDETTLFIGARDTVLSLDISQSGAMVMKHKLAWAPSDRDLDDCCMKGKEKTDCPNFLRVLQALNSTHLFACGTFAFSPRCVYINSENLTIATGPSGKPEEGRGRCPYDPYQRNTAIIVDGELYTGTVADYRGNRPVISRHLSEGSHVDLKLDDTLGWLEDPTFISSAFIRSEEKVYFFFSEVGREYDFIERYTVTRVAQVCTSDVGGQRTLQRRWTTFAKAQLLCQAEGELPYNVLQALFTLPPPEGAPEDHTLFYGIFSSQWLVNSGRSAVCVFRLSDVKTVFSGNYKVLNRDTLRWRTRLQEKVANPGECGLHNASDNTLRFVKENFLADGSVLPVGHRPSLVSPDHDYTSIAAQRVQGADGRDYTVLYLLTESGYLHKAVLQEGGAHIVEEVQVFQQPQAVQSLLLSVSRGAVFVGLAEGVLEVPVANCSLYWCCAECVLARDPFCAWDPSLGICTRTSSVESNAAQDVAQGSVTSVCKGVSISTRSRAPAGELVWAYLNEVVRLQCPAASRLASRHWERPNSRLQPNLFLQQADGSLRFLATPTTLGPYLCVTEENGYRRTLAVYQLRQRSAPAPPPSAPPRSAPPDAPRAGRNFTLSLDWAEPDLRSLGGGQQFVSARPSYLQELVVVSVLLALCVSVLLTLALYSLRKRCHRRTVPLPGPGGVGGAHEREALRGPSARSSRRDAQTQNGHVASGKPPVSISNGMLNGSNGHLPNTPI